MIPKPRPEHREEEPRPSGGGWLWLGVLVVLAALIGWLASECISTTTRPAMRAATGSR